MSPTDVQFAFGDNWASFSEVVNDDRINNAVTCLRRLFPNGELDGKQFLDIGCGSGLSMVAALRLGAQSVYGIDFDPNSVSTARKLLTLYASDKAWNVERRSVFDLTSDDKFPVVYSWGVLHHTGSMREAIRVAANAVETGGFLAIALYRKTPLCGAWTQAKRIYNYLPSVGQTIARGVYKTAFTTSMLMSGRNPIAYARDYKKHRGMSWSHDVHDWLGGYPYESATADEIMRQLLHLNFEVVRSFTTPPGRGIFGTGCDEFVAQLR
jgi:2-polyprenyl-6-hydroxyphenyl methylase/3-demethylubiquinone-9 3-methyltransferase